MRTSRNERAVIRRPLVTLLALFGLLMAMAIPAGGQPGGPPDHARSQGGDGPSDQAAQGRGGPPDHAAARGRDQAPGAPKTVRFATHNTAFSEAYGAGDEGEMLSEFRAGDNEAMQDIAQIIQYQRPDVLQLGEFDYVAHFEDDEYAAVDAFRENYLEVPQGDQDPIHYPYAFVAPSNTGMLSGFDLNRDGQVDGGPEDAWGYGWYEGQWGKLVLSKYPIIEEDVRTFQLFRWADMPGALLPSDPDTDEEGDWYSDEILEEFRLSSKSHWDVPIQIGNNVVHALSAHPTPPAFDGPEQRNVLRNHDEIRLWADYIHPGRGDYLYDDEYVQSAGEEGQTGGMKGGTSFVILGDYNADPCLGGSVPGAIEQLLDNPRVNDRNTPWSEGGPETWEERGLESPEDCLAEPEYHTANFGFSTVRVDYALPSNDLQILDSRVFWPTSDDPWRELADQSDHYMVWVDVRVPTKGAR